MEEAPPTEEEISVWEHGHSTRMAMLICAEIAALERQIEVRQTLLDSLKEELKCLYETLDFYDVHEK